MVIPSHQNVGDTVTETATGSPAEVALETRFSQLRYILKNRNGVWSKGGNYGEATDLTYVEQGSLQLEQQTHKRQSF